MNSRLLPNRVFDRYWLLTTTTYGSWLPGDERGFVSNVRVDEGPEIRHNRPGEAYDADFRGLVEHSKQQRVGSAIEFSIQHAEILLDQFLETAAYRRRWLLCTAVMGTHVHLVVGVIGDPEPEDLLRDFKSYGSRSLNKQFGKPGSGTWWTESGSRRKLPTNEAILGGVRYVLRQDSPRLIWSDEIPEFGIKGGRIF